MTRGLDVPVSLSVLRSANTPQKQLDTLKQLKNDIIGHERRKQIIIKNGVSELLARSLAQKTHIGQIVGSSQDLTLVDQVRLQALFIITSLSHAGNSYIAPLVNGDITRPILAILSDPSTPQQLVLGALRALEAIVTNLRNDPLEDYVPIRDSLYNEIVTTNSAAALGRILEQQDSSRLGEEKFLLALQITRHVASGDTTRQGALVHAGILDLLASKLALWTVAYQTDFKGEYSSFTKSCPPPPESAFCDLILAIASIVQHSGYRSFRFFYSRDIQTIFPTAPSILSSELHTSFADLPLPSVTHPWERLLPQISGYPNKQDSGPKGFPALASLHNIEQSRIPFVSQSPVAVWPKRSDELSSNLLAWLVHMARSSQGNERISVLWLLAVLVSATKLNERFGKPLSLLIVPIIIRLIADEPINWAVSEGKIEITPEAVLAELIRNSELLQSAAVEADAIKLLASKLKKSFDPIKSTTATMWSPTPASSTAEPRSLSSATMLGPSSPTTLLATTLRYRSDAMTALASLAETDDINRKDVLNNGIMGCMLDALTAYPAVQPSLDGIALVTKSVDTVDPKSGNPSFVIISGLKLLVALSRSTHVLRTSLIDSNVAKPVYGLLSHEDLLVRVAATDVTINLVLHFSPMRDDLLKSGVLETLCRQAHSANQELRISSLWALKHLVLQASDTVKVKAFEDLGSGFLMQLLSSDTSPKNHLAAPNAMGEKVDLLNEEPAMEIDDASSSESDGSLYGVETLASIQGRYGPADDYASRLRPLKHSEENPTFKSRRDNIRVQRHALDFIRNVIAEPTASHTALADRILTSFGVSRFFDIIISKLKPRTPGHVPTSGKRPTLTTPGGSGTRAVKFIDPNLYCHQDVVHGALYVLVHLANGKPPHRQLVLSQAGLIQCIVPLFSHPYDKIRSGCCWLVHNLLWQEDLSDLKGAEQRAIDLRLAGIEVEVQHATQDEIMDVKERAKSCVECFTNLLLAPQLDPTPRVWQGPTDRLSEQ